MILLVALGAMGLGIETSRVSRVSTKLQASLDSAVLAAARFDPSERTAYATKVFNANFSRSDTQSVALSFATSNGEFTGNATATIGLHLARLFGRSTASISQSSVANTGSSSRVCVLVLNPTANQAMLVNSGADVDAPECEIHVRSTASPATIFNAGSSLQTKKICIQGTNIIDNGGSHPNLTKNCPTIVDPFAGKLPAPASALCTFSNGNYNGGSVNLSPGVYCGWFNFNSAPNINFAPGVYVIKSGGWNVNGGVWTGNGVTFFFADTSKIQFNSAVDAELTAPTSGTYQDVLFFEPAGLSKSQFIFNDAQGMNLRGLLYLPSREVVFNSASVLTSKAITLVSDTLILDQAEWKLEPSPNAARTGAGSATAVLVR